jgi:hypothetical protein
MKNNKKKRPKKHEKELVYNYKFQANLLSSKRHDKVGGIWSVHKNLFLAEKEP